MNFKYLPLNALEKLELNKLRQIVFDLCESALGQYYAEKMQVSSNYEFIVKALNQVEEFVNLKNAGLAFPSQNFIELGDELNYLEKQNSVLSEEQFLAFMQFLSTVNSIYGFFKKYLGKYITLEAIKQESEFTETPLLSIIKVISSEGKVKGGVSSELDKIRRDIQRTENDLNKSFQKILGHAQGQGWLASGGASIKNGRNVLALHSEYKRKIKGVVHDESATGKTVFLEPEETLEISNELFAYQQEEKREIFRILKALSDEIRPYVSEIRFYQRICGLFDFINAKAKLAMQLNAVMPKLHQHPLIKLQKAVHPLLLLHNKKLNKNTVPLDIELNAGKRILIISGPNAGGKSVALKTIGLLQVMVQSGMLIPVKEGSEMGIFNSIFVELGDEQSIENDLSTYSSHLTHIRQLTEMADDATMFLIDEFGTGTDPMFGGAIAEAVIEELVNKKSIGVVTTHFSNLKLLASANKHIINGSMMFDKERLAPLFLLKIGEPGSSHTFEIAQKIGLPVSVLNNAKNKVDKNYQNFDALLATMETDKHWLMLKQKKLAEDQEVLDNLIKSYAELKEDLEKNKSRILLENKQKALKQAEEQNKKLDLMLSEVKKKAYSDNKENKAAIRLHKELQATKTSLKESISHLRETTNEKREVVDIQKGMYVKMLNGTETGLVEEIRKNKALVSFKTLKTLVNIKELEPVNLAKNDKLKKIAGINYMQAATEFSSKIDVRGKRVDEALQEVETQLDKAMLLNFHSLTILHGTGDGILRKAIRQMLKKYDIVKNVRSEAPEFGGDGITLLDLE